jgi:hypothetical protein
MASVTHPVPSRMTQNLAALFGHADDTLVAWQRACVQAAEALRPQPDPERLAKALALAQDGHVVLEDDGSATVQGSGPQPYTLREGLCHCPDAQKRGLPCKHALAVQIHQQAVALLLPSTSTTPQPSQPKRQARARGSAAWDVHEAPSACFRFRVGNLELMYTLRGIDDAELQSRIAATLPTLQEIMEGCEERAARRVAEREAAQAQAQQAPPAASVPADLQALLQQAVQQALATQANGTVPANGQAKGHTTRQGKPSDQQTGHCSLHDVEMELRQNERGAWYSHYLEDEGRYCKGATK